MDESYDINEILNSINELNNEPAKNKLNKEYRNQEGINTKNISKDDVPPITDQIIKEAEKFKEKTNQKKAESKSYQKISLEMNFYKENYERLIIENNEIKNRLENAKKQLISFEEKLETERFRKLKSLKLKRLSLHYSIKKNKIKECFFLKRSTFGT
mgnify:CR=1 FL=1